MPTESLRVRIHADLMATMLLIRKASDYWHNIEKGSTSDHEMELAQLEKARLPFLTVLYGPEETEFFSSPQRDSAFFRPEVIGYVKQADATRRQRDRERLLQDVRRVLQINTTRAQLAISTRVEDIALDDGAMGVKGFSSFSATLLIRYDFSWASP